MSQVQKTLRRALTAAVLSATALVSLAPVAAELSEEQSEQAIKYRQSVMTMMGGITGTVAGRLRGVEYGPDLPALAAALVATTTDIPALFPAGSDFGETKAEAAVWSDAAGFADSAREATDAAAAFAEAVKSGDKTIIMQAFKSVGSSCKNCHSDYRAE